MDRAHAMEDPAAHSLMIDLGCEVLLQFESAGSQIQGRLIGLEKDYFIIVRPKEASGFGIRAVKGDQAQALYLCEGSVYSFRSTLIHLTRDPLLLLFLSFPVRVRARSLRGRPRVPAFVPASARFGRRAWPGVVLDISRDGLRFACHPAPDGSGPRAGIDDRVGIALEPLSGGRSLTMEGRIRNIDDWGGFPAFGISLEESPGQEEPTLEAYLDRVGFLGQQA